MKVLFILLLSFSAFASNSKYFLENDRAHFVNPALLYYSPDQVSLRSNGEMTFKDGDFFAGVLADDSIMVGIQDDLMGLAATINPKNGQGMGPWSAKVGFALTDFSFYLGASDSEEKEFTPVIGLKTEAYEGTLFAEYEGQWVSVPEFSFLVGYEKIFKSVMFALTLEQENKENELTVMALKKLPVFSELTLNLEAEKELFFSSDAEINLGVEYSFKNLKLEVTHNLVSYENNNLKWADFDFLISLKIGI